MTPYLEIVQADGSSERHPLGGSEHILVGRQPRDGIALPNASELELEHLRLTPRQEGCWFSISQSARVPALVNGQLFTGGLLPWGSALYIGSLWLVVTDSIPVAARPRRTSPLTAVAALGMVGAAFWLFSGPAEPDLPAIAEVRPPALFAAPPSACPEAGPAAVSRAAEAAEAARAKGERYPFAAQDGVRAVELYGLAARCFAAGGRDGDAESATRERKLLAARLDEDYRTHRLKLERAIQGGRTRQALVESRELLSLVAHLEHPYTTWLRDVERHLSLRTGSAQQ